MGIQDVQVRMPLNYEGFRDWFPRFIRDAIVPLDVRNATGEGITVTSDGNSRATLTTQVTQTTVDAAITAHEAAGDPHPVYMTEAETDAQYAQKSDVDGLLARLKWGTGDPEGAITAAKGAIFLRTDGATNDEVLYIKTSGSGTTGWEAVQIP